MRVGKNVIEMMKNFIQLKKIWLTVFVLTGFLSTRQVLAQQGGIPELMYFKFNQITTNQTPNEAPAATRAGGATATVTGLTVGGTGQFSTGLQGNAGAFASNNVNPGWTGTHTGSWTISFWMNVPTPPTTRYMFGNNSGNGTFRCFIGGAANGIRLTGGVPSITLDMPNWTSGISVIHYVYNQATGVVSSYRNGVFQTSATPGASYPLVGTNFYVGAQGVSIEGTMDEFRMYNRALTAQEITDTWDKQLPLVSGPNDAGVSTLTSPNAFCAGQNDIKVMVKNYGNNVINNVQVQWSMNGTPQTPINLNLPLDTFGGAGLNEREVTLATGYNFTSAPVNFKVWTHQPNSTNDTSNLNDTLATTLQASLSGTYTINSAVATGGTNYQTFAAFIDALNTYGVCGPVVANVNASSGPYTEILSFGDIAGTSATNTIRINGNGRTVQYNCDVNNRQLIQMIGTKYLTIDSLNFVSQNATYGWAAIINSGARYDSITRCTFDMTATTSTASASTSGICFSGSLTSATTAGDAKYCYIGGNTIQGPTGSGGYYYALALSSGNDSNIVENNKFLNYYFYGIWLSGSKHNLVNGNEVARPTKTSVTTYYGIYTTGATEGTIIENNRIHTPGGTPTNSTNTAHGIYFLGTGTAAAPCIVTNNAIYNMNSGGLSYGVYLSSATYTTVAHNTIVYDQTQTGTSNQAGIWLLGTNTGLDLYNNIVSITGGNTGTKYGINYTTAVSLSSINDAQKNNIYVNSTQTGAQWHSACPTATTYATLGDFQTAFPTLELGSLSVNPQFTNAAIGNFLPTNSALQGNGQNLGTLVPLDIEGSLRSSLPTPGAWEIPSNPGPDAGVLALIAPVESFCSNQQSVQVSIINSGTVPLTNFQVQWSFNNVSQTPFTYTGTLPIFGQGQHIDTITLGNINIPTGSNTLKVWTAVTNDVNNLNDTLLTTVTPSVFTVNATSDTICVGKDAHLSLTPNSGYASGMLQWQISTNSTTYNNIANSDQPNWTETNVTANSWFRVFINSGTGGCYSDTVSVTIIDPQILTTTPGSSCGPDSVQLAATASAGSIIEWYDVATGGTPLDTGFTFTTPYLSTTTTYYAQPISEGGGGGYVGPVDINIGTYATWSSTAQWLNFSVLSPTTINTVDIFFSAAVNSSFSIVIRDASTLATVFTYNGTTTVSGTTTPQVVPIAATLPVGNYQINMGTIAACYRNSTGAVYPYTIPGVISITGNTFDPNYYYSFYNWNVGAGSCEGTRVPVLASILTPPTPVDLGPDTGMCLGHTVTLDAGVYPTGYTYLWDNNSNNQTRVVALTGNYHVTVTSTNGCTTSDTVYVNAASDFMVDLGNDTIVCDGVLLTLDAGHPNYSHLWDDNSTNQTRTVNTSGLYSVSVINSFGCEARDTIDIIFNPSPSVDLGPDTTTCTANPLTLDAGNAGSTYLWNDNSTNQTLLAVQHGTYYVTVTNGFDCSVSDTINIFAENLPDGDFDMNEWPGVASGKYTFVAQNLINTTSYEWDFGDGSPRQTGSPIHHQYQSTGTYTASLHLINDCNSEVIISKTRTVLVGVDNIISDRDITMYPNPAKDKITIEHQSQLKIESIQIYDALGRLVKEIESNEMKNKNEIELQNWSEGMYNVLINTDYGTVTKKFIISRR